MKKTLISILLLCSLGALLALLIGNEISLIELMSKLEMIKEIALEHFRVFQVATKCFVVFGIIEAVWFWLGFVVSIVLPEGWDLVYYVIGLISGVIAVLSWVIMILYGIMMGITPIIIALCSLFVMLIMMYMSILKGWGEVIPFLFVAVAFFLFVFISGRSIVMSIQYSKGSFQIPVEHAIEKESKENSKIDAIINVAENYKSAGDIDRAMEEIQSGLSKYPDSDILHEKYSQYKEDMISAAMLQNNTFEGVMGSEYDEDMEEIIISKNHTHEEIKSVDEVIEEATCQKEGSLVRKTFCMCGEELSSSIITIPLSTHNYVPQISQVTCLEDGVIENRCSYCGDVRDRKVVAAEGHAFKDGYCTKCFEKDPNYVKKYSGKDIIGILDDSLVTSTDGFEIVENPYVVSVFAKEVTDALHFWMAVSYNLWGYQTQSVTFSGLNGLSELKTLKFYIGGETGSKGKVTVEVYMDKSVDEKPTASYSIDTASVPQRIELDVSKTQVLSFVVKNQETNENAIVFYDFSND